MSEAREPQTAGRTRGRWLRFWAPELAADGVVALDEDQSRHARKVLRLQPGAGIELIDGRGGLAEAELTGYQGRQAVVQIRAVHREAQPDGGVVVAACLPKGSRAEDMVDMLSQAGASAFWPIVAERSQSGVEDKKLARLRKRAGESVKQCGRLWAMDVAEPMAFAEVIQQVGSSGWMLDVTGQQRGPNAAEPTEIVLLIGPEGGWTEAERQAAQQAGVGTWCLGGPVMRVETAAVVATGVALDRISAFRAR